MAGQGQHINVHLLNIYRDMAHGLHGVGVEGNAPFPAQCADLFYGLDGADLVVGKHHRDKCGVGPDGGLHILQTDNAVFVHVQQGDIKALPLKLVQRVQYCVMLKLGGYYVLFAFLCSVESRGTDGLIVGLAAAGCKIDLAGIGSADERSDSLPGFVQRRLGVLGEGVQTGGIAVLLCQKRHHCVQSRLAYRSGSCVVCVYEHIYSLLISYLNNRNYIICCFLRQAEEASFCFFHRSPLKRSAREMESK